jgi:hypothetical protein
VALAAGGAGVGLEGPRSLPAAAAWSALFLASWALLRGRSTSLPPAPRQAPTVAT